MTIFKDQCHDWHILADYPRAHEDGQDSAIYVAAMPAKFYRIVALPVSTAYGDKPGFALDTGSGMERLAQKIAQAVSEGMLGIATEGGQQ